MCHTGILLLTSCIVYTAYKGKSKVIWLYPPFLTFRLCLRNFHTTPVLGITWTITCAAWFDDQHCHNITLGQHYPSPGIRHVSTLEVLRNRALQIDIYFLTYLLTLQTKTPTKADSHCLVYQSVSVNKQQYQSTALMVCMYNARVADQSIRWKVDKLNFVFHTPVQGTGSRAKACVRC